MEAFYKTASGVVGDDGAFSYFAPMRFFEKADAPAGTRRRIAGIASAETRDRDGEVVLQRGLDFSNFLKFGFFNDNHDKGAGAVVGYPTDARFYAKGARLPDGTSAEADLHWTEGYMLSSKRATDIWDAGMALQKDGAPRGIGQSIEGRITKRAANDNSIIAAAEVLNVAVTHMPANTTSSLNFIAKALADVQSGALTINDDDETDKALSTAPSSGGILVPESLERDCIEIAKAFQIIRRRIPQITFAQAGMLLDRAYRRTA